MEIIRVEKPTEVIDSTSPVHVNRQNRVSEFILSEEGNPQGGMSTAEGIEITWQNGIAEPNGATLEDTIALCIDRLEFFQSTRFSCRENALAITQLESAILWLNRRTQNRQRRGVEASYTP